MSDSSLNASSLTVPANLLQPAAAPVGEARTREQIATTAKAFEASFISTMLNSMFQGLSPESPFNGGAGEQAFQSFMTDAMSKQITRHGGIGLASSVQKEMLKMQGLSDPTQTSLAPPAPNLSSRMGAYAASLTSAGALP